MDLTKKTLSILSFSSGPIAAFVKETEGGSWEFQATRHFQNAKGHTSHAIKTHVLAGQFPTEAAAVRMIKEAVKIMEDTHGSS